MFAIGFDLLIHHTNATLPKSVSQAYADIGAVVNRYGFARVQGSVYVSQGDSLVSVTLAMNLLKALPWFPRASVTSARSSWSIGATLRIS